MSRPTAALVTGASRGIGRALSQALVRAGVEVYGTGRDQVALEETARLCRPFGTFHPRLAEVRSRDDVERVVAEPARLDLCINNAGIGRAKPFIETSAAELEELLAVNVIGAFLVMRAAAERMAEQGGGRLVTIASDAAIRPIPQMAAYCASKCAVSALSQILSEELGSTGVRVTTVYPGGVQTSILGPPPPADSPYALMDVDEMAHTVVAAVLAAGDTVQIPELHLRPWRSARDIHP